MTRRRCWDSSRPVKTHTPFAPLKGFAAELRNAGHILGANFVRVQAEGVSVTFSGDIGRPNDPVMNPAEAPVATDYLVIESTYGDRKHPDIDADGGAGSLAEEELRARRRYRDPGICRRSHPGAALADRAAEGARRHCRTCRCTSTARWPPTRRCSTSSSTAPIGSMASRHDAWARSPASSTAPDESKALDAQRGPMIIISAAGMATGGRVLHHLKVFVGDERNLVLFAGFQAPGTRGALMVGRSPVRAHPRP